MNPLREIAAAYQEHLETHPEFAPAWYPVGFWPRFLAGVIESLIIFIASGVLGVVGEDWTDLWQVLPPDCWKMGCFP